MRELHQSHSGIVRIKGLARSYVWWPNMSRDLKAKVHNCTVCQEHREAPAATAPLHTREWPPTLWSRLHLDYTRPFQGQMFLVLVDAHSKWLDVLPVTNSKAISTIEKLPYVFATHGITEKIVTDNGPQFTSEEFTLFLRANGIHHIPTDLYHPS